MSIYHGNCTESTGMHSPPNATGRCEWCGRQVTTPRPRQHPSTFREASSKELLYWYGLMWDPDFPDEWDPPTQVTPPWNPLGQWTKDRASGDEQPHTD